MVSSLRSPFSYAFPVLRYRGSSMTNGNIHETQKPDDFPFERNVFVRLKKLRRFLSFLREPRTR